ncbi:MAG: glycine betaine ABC transporter substrate-binding protein [Streptosporangiaceae bacterium]
MKTRSRQTPKLSAAVAALAMAVGLAACGGGGSAAGGGSSGGMPGKGKPTVTFGDKNFPEEFLLGELYTQALRAKGYTVKLKGNIGSSEIIDKALTSGKIDAYPEYTGVIITVIGGKTNTHPKSEEKAYQMAKKIEAKRGFALLEPTPFQDTDALAVKPPYAKKHHLETIGDLKSVDHWRFGGPAENKTRYEGLVGIHKAYGLHNVTFVPLEIGLQYQALNSGKIDVATVFTTDGQLLQKNKYAVLKDTKHIFGFQQAAPVVNKKVLKKEGPAFKRTLNKVSSLLTFKAMQQLNAAVVLNHQDAGKVASKFLKANGLK